MSQHDLNNTVFSFLGAPGSGKGTLARKCGQELGFNMLSTGDLCRKHISEGTDIGNQVKGLIEAGHLIPDDLMTTMIKGWLDSKLILKKPIILDGYPRTVGQYKLFKSLREAETHDFNFRVILFEIPDELIIDRLVNRRVCENKDCQAVYSVTNCPSKKEGICDKCCSHTVRRSDDQEDIVRARLERFARYRDDILEHCKSIGQLVERLEVNDKSIEQVFEQFKRIL